MMGLLLCNLCLHSNFRKLVFFWNAIIRFSLNSGAICGLMDKIFQLSSIAFLRSGRFLLYVTTKILGFFGGFSVEVFAVFGKLQ